jgi:hypothetical protein
MTLAAKSCNESEIWDDGIDWSGLPAHLSVNSLEDLYKKLEEGEADERAGRVIWLDDAVDEILQDIENGTIQKSKD